MLRRKVFLLLTALLTCAALAACGASGPKQLTLKYDSSFMHEAFAADGDPFMQEVGTVPKGAVCDFGGKFMQGWDQAMYALVENCSLDGTDYGDGAVSIERFAEAESLRELAKQK